jgi:hypothetical protein
LQLYRRSGAENNRGVVAGVHVGQFSRIAA